MRENPQEHREVDILLDVGGMHCVNCAALVERKLAALPQVIRVNVDRRTGRAVIGYRGELDMAALQGAVADEGYTLTLADPLGRPRAAATRRWPRDYIEIAATFAILIGVVVILRQFALLPRGVSVSDTMTLGLAFVVGLVASVSSCIAVTGGLLVAVAAKYNAAHAHLTDLERLKPHIYFNAGRIVSYTLLGGAVGALGSALMPSPAATGILTLLASAVMIVLGLQMLGLAPSLAGLLPAMPKSVTDRVHAVAAREARGTAFLLGGLTFFLPCGFTQALQLYVLAKGDALTGAMTMLAFALGTLPALLSLSALSSFAKGAVRTHLLRFAGAAVILLGVLNVQYGLVLTGSDMNRAGGEVTAVPTAPKGQYTAASEPQRISMKIVGLDYQPNRFAVRQGVPVEWWIDASDAEGCGRILLAPGLHIQKILSGISTTLIAFTPEKPGEFAFNCGMGMMTPDSKITVLPRDRG
jgi:sulfite exporter TauE/SafE/copper chaperone CopZ